MWGRQGWGCGGEQTFPWAKFSSEQCAASESKGNSLLGAIFLSGKVDDFPSSWNTDIKIKIKSKFYITIKTTKEWRKRSCVKNWDNSSNWAECTNGSNGRWRPLILPREASYCKDIYKVTKMWWTVSCQSHPILVAWCVWGCRLPCTPVFSRVIFYRHLAVESVRLICRLPFLPTEPVLSLWRPSAGGLPQDVQAQHVRTSEIMCFSLHFGSEE